MMNEGVIEDEKVCIEKLGFTAVGGAVIEAFHTVKDAEARDTYLSGFDGAGMLSPGSHRVVGTLVIRTSDELSASDQKKLENRIVDALIKLE